MGHPGALCEWRQLGEHSAGLVLARPAREVLRLVDPPHLEGRREAW